MARKSSSTKKTRRQRSVRFRLERLEPRWAFSASAAGGSAVAQPGWGEELAALLTAGTSGAIPTAERPLTNLDHLPMVYAGADAATPALTNLQLTGEVLVNDAVDMQVRWRMVSGPGSVTFANSLAVATTAQFSVPGSYELELEAINGGVVATDRLLVNVSAANIVNIDQAWLDARGPGPYYLDRARTTYVLQTDVVTEGTAFAILANDVTLDLNGRTVTYNNAAPIRTPNGSFELGADGGAKDWDFSAAANASRHAGQFLDNDVYDGSHSLKFSLPAGDQYVTSQGKVTLQPHATYSLSAMFWRGSVAKTAELYVELVADDGSVAHRLAYSRGNARGIQFAEQIVTTGAEPASYFIRAGVSGADNPEYADASVFIDDIKIQRTRDYGVAVSAFDWRMAENPWATRFGQADRAAVRNGRLIQGQDGGTWSHNVYGYRASGLHVEGVTGEVHGANGSSILGEGGEVRIQGNHFTSNVVAITSRDQMHGAMIGHGLSGEFSGNTLLNGPHMGLRLSDGVSQVFNNVIRMRNRYTNGFAIGVYGLTATSGPAVEIRNNVIDQGSDGYSGRGIFVSGNAASDDGTPRVRIFNNRVTVQQLRNNQEYRGAVLGGAYGIQLDGARDVEIFGNTVVGRAEQASAFALRINNNSTNNVVRDNEFQGIRVGEPVIGRYGAVETVAGSLKIGKLGGDASNLFLRNTLTTNSLWLGDFGQLPGLVLGETTLKIAGDAAHARWFEIDANTHNATNAAQNIRFVDAIFDSPEARVAFEQGRFWRADRNHTDGFSSYLAAWTTELSIVDDDGAAAPNAGIVVKNVFGDVVFTGATDAAGRVTLVLDEFKSQGVSLAAYEKIGYNDHVVEVTVNGAVSQRTFRATATQKLRFAIPRNPEVNDASLGESPDLGWAAAAVAGTAYEFGSASGRALSWPPFANRLPTAREEAAHPVALTPATRQPSDAAPQASSGDSPWARWLADGRQLAEQSPNRESGSLMEVGQPSDARRVEPQRRSSPLPSGLLESLADPKKLLGEPVSVGEAALTPTDAADAAFSRFA